MTEPTRLPDRWHTRDFPVLLAVAKRLDDGEMPVSVHDIAPDVEVDWDKVVIALKALTPTYIEGKPIDTLGGTMDFFVTGLTERGRRAVGLWPDEDAAAEALVELLNKAADQTTDEDDAGALRKAGRLLRSVPSAVLADVTAAIIRQQTGL